jgi:hypothetical protein
VRRPASPQADPRFQRVVGKLHGDAARLKHHPPARKKAADAQAAARPPANEKLAGAKAKQVDVMKEADTGKPEPDSFLALLRAEIEKVMPQTLDDAKNFMEGGKKEQLQSAVSGNIKQQKDEAAGDLKGAAAAPPNPGGVPGKPVTPLPGEPATPAPAVNGAEALPAPKPDADISLQQSKKDADQQMAEAKVTPDQLRKANDPRFSAVLTAKSKLETQADKAPQQYRAGERGVLAGAAAKAQADARAGAAALVGVKTRSGANVSARQLAAKEKDEARRKVVSDTIENIYNKTKRAVEAKLASLETDVMRTFDAGTNAALANMKSSAQREIDKFYDERYTGPVGWGRWLADRFRPAPEEVKQIIARARGRFTTQMDALVVRVAGMVDARLKQAKDEINRGQAEIKTYVDKLPKDLQAVGRAAEQEMSRRFDEMRQGVEDRKNALAQKLAEKYKEASDKADALAKKMEEENAGLFAGFAEFLGEVIKILTEFKEKLMALLRKGADTIMMILKDPIGFLGNLIAAIKQGLSQFVGNIWTHLKKGFMAWLFGSLASAGVEPPADLSLPSIFKLVMQILGLTYERLRAKAVKLIGERNVRILEKLFEYVKTLITEGPAALWEKVKADLGNLKEMVIDAIQNWIITTVIKAAITKLVSMFNPAGAIVQAVIAIYNTVMFLIEKAAQIMAFVEAVINSVSAIAQGAIGGAANWIEQSLARMIPLLIGFLARLIGLGGITDKIKEIIKKVQGVVDRAIDKVIAKIVALVKKLFGKGKDGKAEDPEKEKQLKAGITALDALTASYDKQPLEKEQMTQQVSSIKRQHPVFKTLSVTEADGQYTYDYTASPGTKKSGPSRGKGEYNVGEHVVSKPSGVRGSGESHHVPVKVLKRWIGEILEIAGSALTKAGNPARGKSVRAKGTEYKNDTQGSGLSAIWLSEKDHVAAHAAAKPGQLNVSGDFVVKTEAGDISSRPLRGTIARTVHGAVVGGDAPDQRAKANREIYEAKANRLPSLLRSAFDALLEAGVGFVARVKLKDNKWKSSLTSKAKSTWAQYLKVPK